MAKKHEEDHENLERWLLTYADMITLLMAFFILLYTMSKIDAAKYAELSKQLKNKFGGNISVFTGQDMAFDYRIFQTVGERGTFLTVGNPKLIPVKFQLLVKDFKTMLRRNNIEDVITIFGDKKGLVISILTDGILFDLQSPLLKPEAQKILDVLGVFLQNLRNPISVEGHTDELRYTGQGDPLVNWHLSANRALSVLRYLVSKNYVSEKRISLSAFAANRPVRTDEKDEEKRRRLCRRVDLVILGETPIFTHSDINLSDVKKELDIGW